jgi:hypothetical protein
VLEKNTGGRSWHHQSVGSQSFAKTIRAFATVQAKQDKLNQFVLASLTLARPGEGDQLFEGNKYERGS